MGNREHSIDLFLRSYRVVVVPIAAGVLRQLVGLLLSPMIASAAMAFESVSVIGST